MFDSIIFLNNQDMVQIKINPIKCTLQAVMHLLYKKYLSKVWIFNYNTTSTYCVGRYLYSYTMGFLIAVFFLMPYICISEEMMPNNDTLIIYHNAAPRNTTKPKELTKDREEQKRILQERRLLYTQYVYSRSVREKRKLFNNLYEIWAQRMGYEKDDYKKDKELIRGFRLILGSEDAIYRALFKSFFQFERPTFGRFSHSAANSKK